MPSDRALNGIMPAAMSGRICFKTLRAIRAFGNAGRAYDNEQDAPLSDHDRQTLSAIQQVERIKHCPQ
jgi:hypothetical protein